MKDQYKLCKELKVSHSQVIRWQTIEQKEQTCPQNAGQKSNRRIQSDEKKKKRTFWWLKREIQSNKDNGLELPDRNPGRSEEETPSFIKGFGNLGFRQAELKWYRNITFPKASDWGFHNITLSFSPIANTL